MFVVIGEGPNRLEIPLVFFTTKEAAEEFIKQFPHDKEHSHLLSDDFSEQHGEFYTEDEEHPLYKKLFAGGRYYSGCGGCYMLSVRPVVEGEPIVGWDLD